MITAGRHVARQSSVYIGLSTSKTQGPERDDNMSNAPSKHLKEIAPRRQRTVASPAVRRKITVVGTSGYLSPHVVAALLRTGAGPGIVCINRSTDGEQRTIAALASIGVDCSGHLSDLRFLIADVAEPATWTSQDGLLTFDIDEVIFNAWNSNWSLPLQSFEPLLRAMQNAIEFCASSSRRPRITFISSICAVGEWPRKHPGEPLMPEDIAWDRGSAIARGYGESKCIAEQLLARAHAASGLRIAIVRAGQIGGPAMSDTARSFWPVQGWMYSLVKASDKTGCWPTHVQPLDWIPVDALADGVANITRTGPDARAVQVFNMVHPRPAPW